MEQQRPPAQPRAAGGAKQCAQAPAADCPAQALATAGDKCCDSVGPALASAAATAAAQGTGSAFAQALSQATSTGNLPFCVYPAAAQASGSCMPALIRGRAPAH